VKREITCKNCGNIFLSSSGVARYCMDCRDIMIEKNAHDYRKYRKKIKEIQDGSNNK
jgi:hypothetical protein